MAQVADFNSLVAVKVFPKKKSRLVSEVRMLRT